MSGLTLSAAVARRRHRNPTRNKSSVLSIDEIGTFNKYVLTWAPPRILRLRIRERSERKKVPPLFQMSGTSKQISVRGVEIQSLVQY